MACAAGRAWATSSAAATRVSASGEYSYSRFGYRVYERREAEVYAALPKATAGFTHGPHHWRIRFDRVDTGGTVTLRWAGRLRHLGIGRGYKHTPVTNAGSAVNDVLRHHIGADDGIPY